MTKIPDDFRKLCLVSLIVLLSLLHWGALNAQQGHYWTHQYGVRSTLLGNSVIGSVEDLGAVFYNPARLAVIEDPSFLLSADIYEWTTLEYTDAFSEGQSVNRNGFGNAPGFGAGSFNLKFINSEKNKFAYSIMGRERTSNRLNYRNEVERDVLPDIEGDEIFGAGLDVRVDSRTRWYTVSWSHLINPKLGFGLSLSGTRTSLSRSNDIDLQALGESGEVGLYRFSRRYNVNQYGALAKLGVAGVVFDKVEWGVTATTPNIKIKGKGNYTYEEYLANGVDMSDIFASSTQKDLDAQFKTPFSIGAGFAIPINNLKIHVSSEWFSKIEEYILLQAEPHIGQSSGDTIGFALFDDLRSVINFGLGLEYAANEKLRFYASINSDYSAVRGETASFTDNDDFVSNSEWTADFWHYAAGALFKIRRNELTLGFSRTRAKQDFGRPIDFPDEDGDIDISPDEPGTLRWSRLQLIVGLSIKFGKRTQEEVPDTGID